MCSSSAAFCCMLLMPSSIAAGLRAQHRRVRGDRGPAAPRPCCPRRQLRGASPPAPAAAELFAGVASSDSRLLQLQLT